MARTLRAPEEARAWLRRRYANQHRTWLGGGGSWPLGVSLGDPTERDVAEDPVLVRQWVADWTRWSDGGEVEWQERQWSRLGTQRLPSRLVLHGPGLVARVVGEGQRFERAFARRARLVRRWNVLTESPRVERNFQALADYTDDDFERLLSLLEWLELNRKSWLYLRQLPVEGLDTKWCDGKRLSLVTDLLHALRAPTEAIDFFSLAGIRQPPWRLRLRVLCPELRRGVGGLCDIEAPTDELATLALAPARILVVENLQTGLALPDLPGCVAFMKLGKSVSLLSRIPWAARARAFYWGDIDSHGLAIVGLARAVLPGLATVLMDEATLLEHRSLWAREDVSHTGTVGHLTPSEQTLFDSLRGSVWGPGVRLEQERIPWVRALAALRAALQRDG